MAQHDRKIIHIDMDCFFAAVEMRDNPHFKARPIAVGGDPGRRGVISTCNYIARRFGVRSAMPTAHALQLCPELIVLPGRMDAYREASSAIHSVFSEFTDLIEPLSLDEAFLDVSACSVLHGSATLIAQEIRHRIFKNTQLLASAGIAPNKFLAKIASDWNKPNNQFSIPPTDITDFMPDLPVSKICGVGRVTQEKMAKLDIHTCGDLQQWSKALLLEQFGKFGEKLFLLCRGEDNRDIETSRIRKSLSVEHTFNNDLMNFSSCDNALPDLFDEMTRRLKKYSERLIQKQFIKIKFSDFSITTIERSACQPSLDNCRLLLEAAYHRHSNPVRLIGVGVRFHTDTHIQPFKQLDLFHAHS